MASSPWVLLAVTFFLIISGSLVPRKTLNDMKQDRDNWKEAHRISELARSEAMAIVSKQAEAQEAVANAIESLPLPSRNVQRRRSL